MSTQEFTSCDQCRYYGLDGFGFPCCVCKHGIPPSDPAYETAVDRYVPASSNSNSVNHPSHYNQGGIECIDAMVAAFGKEAVSNFCMVNAFKYIWRMEHKNGVQDIDKAIWYLNKVKELKYGE